MSKHHTYIKLSSLLVITYVSVFATSGNAQSQATPSGSPENGVAAAQGSIAAAPENKIVAAFNPKGPVTKPTPDANKPGDVQAELDAVKAENAIVREQVRLMFEQQQKLLLQVSNMQRKIDNEPKLATPTADDATGLSAAAARPGDPADPGVASVSSAQTDAKQERYQEGIVLWKTPDTDKTPFLLRMNVVTQFRYLNTLDSPTSYTDHLGVERSVHRRNDVTVNRTMFTLSGYMFNKKLQYSMLVWTAAGVATIIVAGSIGWQFNKYLTVTGGYLGIPGSRSLTNTFPYFTSTDRTMADNFFRPGFTQGVMASGELKKNLYYMAFLGNSLNTLSITANKIDTNLMGGATVWWEPLGHYAPPGRSVNMYDDYFAEKRWRIRLGTSFTVSREDRFSALDTSSPENTGVYNSDGVNAFQTGAFGIGVTMKNATYKMWAADWGLKYNGLAINGQYYWRTLSNFDADGPLTLKSTFDHGYEFSVAKFVIPKKVMLYGRASGIFGAFRSPYEVGAGLKWHPLPTEKLWMNAELMRIHRGAAYSGAFSPYTSGMTGWVPMIQTVLAF